MQKICCAVLVLMITGLFAGLCSAGSDQGYSYVAWAEGDGIRLEMRLDSHVVSRGTEFQVHAQLMNPTGEDRGAGLAPSVVFELRNSEGRAVTVVMPISGTVLKSNQTRYFGFTVSLAGDVIHIMVGNGPSLNLPSGSGSFEVRCSFMTSENNMALQTPPLTFQVELASVAVAGGPGHLTRETVQVDDGNPMLLAVAIAALLGTAMLIRNRATGKRDG